MKKLLIIYPHWPPSNLAGVHRPRLIGNFISAFGWKPIVLTVDAKFYEETLDAAMCQTVSSDIEVHRVNAFKPLKRLRFFGDIGIRGGLQLYHGALKLIREEGIDFIWIPIPSFYTAVLGRLLFEKTGVRYGIDYIDPWVNGFTNYKQPFTKAWISNKIAQVLEPFSVKKASLISGVASAYFAPVLDRNFKNKSIESVGMPYGFDPRDHDLGLELMHYPWDNLPDCEPFVYAGAFLPQSKLFIELLFKSIYALIQSGKWKDEWHLFFIGTGYYQGKTLQTYANEAGIGSYVHELKERRPFLEVLTLLNCAKGVMVIGSTERHYTASKIFQSLLSKRPVFAVLHEESSAVQIMRAANAANYLCTYSESVELGEFETRLVQQFFHFVSSSEEWTPTLKVLDAYSARESAEQLAHKLDLIVSQP